MYLIFFVSLFIIKLIQGQEANKIFEIEWSKSSIPQTTNNTEMLNVTSSIGEQYVCLIPDKNSENFNDTISYQGPLAADFIEHLFNKKICSYRLDPYWTYEICHGKYTRQYHEILDGSRLKLQQFTLGKMSPKEQELLLAKMKDYELKLRKDSSYRLPTKRIQGKEIPYVDVLMTDGSPCEFNRRKLRQCKIYYVCNLKGNHDIYSIEEVESCKYEAVILTPLLCAHPKYRLKKNLKTIITCYASAKSNKMPYQLAKIYSERNNIINRAYQDGDSVELSTFNKKSKGISEFDQGTIHNFLSGKNCITGGTGEWKYEFCYGKYINQYTYGIFGLRKTVCLGKFNVKKHLNWIREHPYKRPKPVKHRSYITQFYSDGCVSNVTGRPRQTEIKLKCMDSYENMNSLVMYLYETNFGEYLLGIESPLLCHIIPMADEDGLISFNT